MSRTEFNAGQSLSLPLQAQWAPPSPALREEGKKRILYWEAYCALGGFWDGSPLTAGLRIPPLAAVRVFLDAW